MLMMIIMIVIMVMVNIDYDESFMLQTFIGNFNKEQEQFLKEKERRKTGLSIIQL